MPVTDAEVTEADTDQGNEVPQEPVRTCMKVYLTIHYKKTMLLSIFTPALK